MDDWRFREIDQDQLQMGDILVYNDPSNLVSRLVKWVVGRNHVSMAWSKRTQFEARAFKGSRENPINNYNFRVFRPVRISTGIIRELSETDKQNLHEFAAEHLSGKGYGYVRNIKHWLNARFFTNWFTKDPGMSKMKGLECSGVVAVLGSELGIKWYCGFGLDPRYIDQGRRVLIDEEETGWWTLHPGEIFKNIIWRLVE